MGRAGVVGMLLVLGCGPGALDDRKVAEDDTEVVLDSDSAGADNDSGAVPVEDSDTDAVGYPSWEPTDFGGFEALVIPGLGLPSIQDEGNLSDLSKQGGAWCPIEPDGTVRLLVNATPEGGGGNAFLVDYVGDELVEDLLLGEVQTTGGRPIVSSSGFSRSVSCMPINPEGEGLQVQLWGPFGTHFQVDGLVAEVGEVPELDPLPELGWPDMPGPGQPESRIVHDVDGDGWTDFVVPVSAAWMTADPSWSTVAVVRADPTSPGDFLAAEPLDGDQLGRLQTVYAIAWSHDNPWDPDRSDVAMLAAVGKADAYGCDETVGFWWQEPGSDRWRAADPTPRDSYHELYNLLPPMDGPSGRCVTGAAPMGMAIGVSGAGADARLLNAMTVIGDAVQIHAMDHDGVSGSWVDLTFPDIHGRGGAGLVMPTTVSRGPPGPQGFPGEGPATGWSVVWVDLDGDGDQDLIVGTSPDSGSLNEGGADPVGAVFIEVEAVDGELTFQQWPADLLGDGAADVHVFSLDLTDLGADGCPDLVVGGATGVHVWRHACAGANHSTSLQLVGDGPVPDDRVGWAGDTLATGAWVQVQACGETYEQPYRAVSGPTSVNAGIVFQGTGSCDTIDAIEVWWGPQSGSEGGGGLFSTLTGPYPTDRHYIVSKDGAVAVD